MFKLMPTPVKLAHLLIRQHLKPGAVAVDATVGNGHDTVLLARLVGVNGKVFGFDIQESGLLKANEKLQAEGLLQRVALFNNGHQHMGELIDRPVDAIMYNLGYLPGGNHEIVTLPDTTEQALNQSMELMKPGGLTTVVIYPGHSGGQEEANKVEKYVAQLPKAKFSCVKFCFLNRSQQTPYLIAIEKVGGSTDEKS